MTSPVGGSTNAIPALNLAGDQSEEAQGIQGNISSVESSFEEQQTCSLTLNQGLFIGATVASGIAGAGAGTALALTYAAGSAIGYVLPFLGAGLGSGSVLAAVSAYQHCTT